MNGPLSPEEFARMQAYYGGTPGQNMSPADAPPPPPPAPPITVPSTGPVDITAGLGPPPASPPGADYFGPPPPPPKPPPPPGDPFGVGLAKPAATPVVPTNLPVSTVQGVPPNAPPAPAVVSSPFAAAPGATVSAPVVNRGGGAGADVPAAGVGAVNRDPFGIGAANKALLSSYDQQRAGIEHQAGAEGARAVRRGDAQEQLARRQEEDAAIEHAQNQIADQQFGEHMQEIQRQMDDLREKKIDPTRKLQDKGLGLLAIVGGLMGGLYQGVTKSATNPFLDELHAYFSREMETQRLDLENGRAAVGDQMNLLGQMRAIYKDSRLADAQTRNMLYEATKQQIEAEAQRDEDPIAKARAEQALAAVNHDQAILQKQIAEQSRAQAAASAAQQMAQIRAARDRLDKLYMETYHHNIAAGHSPAQAEYEAQRVVLALTTKDGPGPRPAGSPGATADVLANVPKAQQDLAGKELETHAKAQKAVAQIDDLFQQYKALPATAGPYDRDREALEARILAAYKQGLGPEAHLSSDNDAKAFLQPLQPGATESDATTEHKKNLIRESIEASYATPILDTHNPGWRGANADVKHYDLAGKPK